MAAAAAASEQRVAEARALHRGKAGQLVLTERRLIFKIVTDARELEWPRAAIIGALRVKCRRALGLAG
jgi:hypothetical protein